MWLAKQMDPPERDRGLTLSRITGADREGVDAVGVFSCRRAPMLTLPGYCGLPAAGEEALLTELEGESLVCGILSRPAGLEPGEVCISSAGGARITLKNNGDILLEGHLVTGGDPGQP